MINLPEKKDPTLCSLGKPTGDGLRIGFPGWEKCDIQLDPAIALDMQVEREGLNGLFERVVSLDLLHRLHGDCTLTHGVKALHNLLVPIGTVEVEFLCMDEVLKEAIGHLDDKEWIHAQVLEKTAFGQAVDADGLLYPQTMISVEKAQVLFTEAGFENFEVIKRPAPNDAALLPDMLRLTGVEDKVWEASAQNFTMGESLSADRPTCVLCEHVVTKRDHDRRYFSRYCKEHYHIARGKCDKALYEAFSAKVRARRKK